MSAEPGARKQKPGSIAAFNPAAISRWRLYIAHLAQYVPLLLIGVFALGLRLLVWRWHELYPLGGDERGVDVVHLLLDAPLEGAVQRRDREEPRVALGELAEVGEVEPPGVAAGELDGERSELRGQRDERPEDAEVLG